MNGTLAVEVVHRPLSDQTAEKGKLDPFDHDYDLVLGASDGGLRKKPVRIGRRSAQWSLRYDRIPSPP